MRVRARRDANHRDIVEGLRDAGCSVLDLSQLGHGVPDILVGSRGTNYLLEIKSLNERLKMSDGAARSLVRQQAWFTMWRGGEVRVVTSLSEALNAVGVRTAAIKAK